jgi:hypothetical protein
MSIPTIQKINFIGDGNCISTVLTQRKYRGMYTKYTFKFFVWHIKLSTKQSIKMKFIDKARKIWRKEKCI